MKRNLPTINELKVTEAIKSSLTSQKKEWLSFINEYPRLSNDSFELPFFGKVKKEKAGMWPISAVIITSDSLTYEMNIYPVRLIPPKADKTSQG